VEGGVWGEFRLPRPASSVRIFSNRHRQESHFEKSKLEASALCAEAISYDFTKSENWRCFLNEVRTFFDENPNS